MIQNQGKIPIVRHTSPSPPPPPRRGSASICFWAGGVSDEKSVSPDNADEKDEKVRQAPTRPAAGSRKSADGDDGTGECENKSFPSKSIWD